MVSRMHLPLVQRRAPYLVDSEACLDDCAHDLGGVDGANLEGRHRFLSFVADVHLYSWKVFLSYLHLKV